MRAAVFEGPGNIRIQQVPDPEVELATDAVVRVVAAGICGSDLWSYRGYGRRMPGSRIGHEFIGVVEDVGADVRTVRAGDLVISPFTWSDGTCEYCIDGLQTSCVDGGVFAEPGHDGAQGEALRVPHADGTLIVVPLALQDADPALLLPLCDVLPTGHHAAQGRRGPLRPPGGGGRRRRGRAVRGARLAPARRRDGGDDRPPRGAAEAGRPVRRHRHRARPRRGGGRAGHDAHRRRARGAGVRRRAGVLDTAVAVARDGATIGYVGVPHLVEGLDLGLLFGRNIGIAGGVTPARAYIPELLKDVALGNLDASAVFDATVDLDGVPDGYVAMDGRKAVKVRVDVCSV